MVCLDRDKPFQSQPLPAVAPTQSSHVLLPTLLRTLLDLQINIAQHPVHRPHQSEASLPRAKSGLKCYDAPPNTSECACSRV